MPFERRFNDIQKLEKEQLFNDFLRPDIVETFPKKPDRYGEVFPAVREGRIDFYHRGGKLFSYDGSGFTTHYKYASVIKHSGGDYVTDTNLQAIESFVEGYKRIKENCSLYSGEEALGIAQLYRDFSCAKRERHRVVVLDIEISLRRGGDIDKIKPDESHKANSDRIDLLLFDTDSRKLHFFEGKHFSNSSIRAVAGRTPMIVKQMNRYKKQFSDAIVREQLLSGYAVHVDVINQLFAPQTPLPKPEEIDPVPGLLIFGFDESQRDEKLDDEVHRLESDYGLSVYAIGNVDAATSGTLLRWCT